MSAVCYDFFMKKDFLAQCLGNLSRARVLRTFVLNEGESFSVRDLAKRSGASAQAAAKEIKALSELGVILKMKGEKNSRGRGGKRAEERWTVNQDFKHARSLASFVRDTSPVQNTNVLTALKGSGKLSLVVVSGFFIGDSTRPADLLIAGEGLDVRRIERAMKALEPDIGRELRYATFSTPEFRYRLTVQDKLIRDTLDYPHRVLLDKVGLI